MSFTYLLTVSLKHYLICFCVILGMLPVVAFGGNGPRSVRAVRVQIPPKIDGMLGDEVWKLAEPTADFIQREPNEGKPVSEPSEIRVLYDDEALYFGCMYYDSQPQEIVSRLTRRDNEIETDRASIRIDSYHDHQTGYEFSFTPAGVKIDILQYDDANREDDSWDPVWELETNILPNGWCAEIKIPFRILRYHADHADTAENIWGVNFFRVVSRNQEEQHWAFIPKNVAGIISRYGHLLGLQNLPEPHQLDVLPFVTAKQSYDPQSFYRSRRSEFHGNAGVDIKYALSSNVVLDATINPDFGQVEADPAVLNLSTYETFYPEKRPFFVEGTQIIRFTTFGGDFGPGMFYSRRIGRAISEDEVDVSGVKEIVDIPQITTILGAAKISAKTNSGLSLGILQAFTQEEKATVLNTSGVTSEQILEPFAHYNVIRLKQDFFGNSNVGLIFTSTAKNSRAPAFTNGYDWSIRLDDNTYLASGFLALSHRTNPLGERVTGSAGKFGFSRIAGTHWLWSLGADYTSRQYNINDVGFFFSPDDFGGSAQITYKEDVPAQLVRNYNIGLSLHYRNNFDGANLARDFSINSNILFANYWSLELGAGAEFGIYDQRETRGNGLYRKPNSYSTSVSLTTDERNDIVVSVEQGFSLDTKIKFQSETTVGIAVKPLTWMEWQAEYEYGLSANQEAWFTNNAGQSIFGDRTTHQNNLILRSTITFTREITLQFYSQVFLAKGYYENFRRLAGTSDFISTPVSVFDPPIFSNRAFNTNLVLRWEYLPGSTIFFVWSHARQNENNLYSSSIRQDFDDTFRIPPSNVLLLKLSYLLNLQ